MEGKWRCRKFGLKLIPVPFVSPSLKWSNISSDGTIYRIVSNIAILIHIVAYLYRDNYPSNEVSIPHNSAIPPWFILAIIKLM